MLANTGRIDRQFWLLVLAAGLLVGCGRDGPSRYDISGTVTFDGQPVAAGTISFDPLEPGIGGGFAPILEGKYDTAAGGRGHLGGKTRVSIAGSSGKLTDPNNPDSGAAEVYPVYESTLDLPTGRSSRDFELAPGG